MATDRMACVGGPMNGRIVRQAYGSYAKFPIRQKVGWRYAIYSLQSKTNDGLEWWYLKYERTERGN